MLNTAVVHRYTKAFFDLAKEKKQIDEVIKDWKAFVAMCNESRDLRLLLKSPVVGHLKKQAVLMTLLKGSFSKITTSFISLTTKKGRAAYLLQIAHHFVELYKEDNNIKSIQLVTARPLDEKQKKEIIAYISGRLNKKIEIEEIIDPTIIGGFVLKFDSLMLDKSIGGQLSKLKTLFIGKEVEQ